MELSVYSHTLSKLRGECWGVAAAKNLHRILCRQAGPPDRAARGQPLEPQPRLQRSWPSRSTASGPTPARCSSTPAWCCLTCCRTSTATTWTTPSRAQTAAANHVGFWGSLDATAGPARRRTTRSRSPSTGTPTATTRQNVNGEWVDIINQRRQRSCRSAAGGSATRRTAGTKAHGYVFPAGAQVAPGEQVRLRIGHGTDGDGTYYWGLDIPIFANVTGGAKWLGDGAWLFDPQGDLRAWYMYPCRAAC